MVQKAKHMPGTWYSSDKCLIFRSDWDEETLIAQAIPLSYVGDDFSEQMANARLIAAAPEMLEALQGLIQRYDAENAGSAFESDAGCIECTSGTVPNNLNTGLCPHHKALAAIAKATGGSV